MHRKPITGNGDPHRPSPRWRCLSILGLAMLASPGSEARGAADAAGSASNTWVELHRRDSGDWHRQQHAGIAYDSRRGQLLVFGSDTHGSDWDNSLQVFDPAAPGWSRRGEPVAPDRYRVSDDGIPVAGDGDPWPWAMHTFDTVVYDPVRDALVVAAVPLHNPARKGFDADMEHPTWVHDLKTGTWSTLPSPINFFAGSAAYDHARDTIVAYRHGIWELGPERKAWVRALSGSHHGIHHSMVYDRRRGELLVFGDHGDSRDIWVYTPGKRAGAAGSWDKRDPGGDDCPADQHFPVDYSEDDDLFVLVPDEHREGQPGRAVTCIYDPRTNTYHRLDGADLPAQGMNYMMVYDPKGKRFLLVSGNHAKPTTVHALRLDPRRLGIR
jgi:hypothetical protein